MFVIALGFAVKLKGSDRDMALRCARRVESTCWGRGSVLTSQLDRGVAPESIQCGNSWRGDLFLASR